MNKYVKGVFKMKKSVKVIALIMSILTIVGILFSVASFAESPEADNKEDDSALSISYIPLNKNIDVFVSNDGLCSLTKISDKFIINDSLTDVVSYLKEINRFNPETQYLVVHVNINEGISIPFDATSLWAGIIKINDQSSFFLFDPNAALIDIADTIDITKPSIISLTIFEKNSMPCQKLPFVPSI